MLNWASWLRMHHQDPQWVQSVLKEDSWKDLDFNVWDKLENWNSLDNVNTLDTTALSVVEVARAVYEWIIEGKNVGESISNSQYKLYKNTKNAFKIIDSYLFAFNKKCVPATPEPTVIDKNYIIKQNEVFVAGIAADIYIWKILYISLLFVNEEHRDQDLGSMLLKMVESEAKAIGVKLVHTDTFDFQAKDFYLKHGYEIFGVLDDCPAGHKRYYMSKKL